MNNYSELVGVGRDIHIYLLQVSDILQNAHLQFHVTSTAKHGSYLEKQNIPKWFSTSANILHEFLICCYDPTAFPN